MESDEKDDATKDEDIIMGEASGISSPKELRNALYARCASQEEDKDFSQEDLLSFKIIPEDDLEKLLVCTKELTVGGLFKLRIVNGKTCWRVIKKDDAAKYKSLTPDEALVYSYIESSGREGIWSKLLRNRTNFHMTTMNRAIKGLENRNYIKSIKTIKYPTRKTYILSKLQPSEDVTGGSFYTDGVLDDEYIHQMSLLAERYVIGRSWWHPPLPESNRKKGHRKIAQGHAEDFNAGELQGKGAGRERSEMMLPMPPGYKGYPTVPEITRAVNASEISVTILKASEMQQLIDILCWDGRLEKLKIKGTHGYRATRHAEGLDRTGSENGLTEAPCGRCPAFEICEDDGPVNARTCVYFQDWLKY